MTNNLKRLAVAYPLYQKLIDEVESCEKLSARERIMYARELRLEGFAALDSTAYRKKVVFADSSTVMGAICWRKAVKGADFWVELEMKLDGIA